MAYFASTEVTVFPSVKRANGDSTYIDSKQMLEANVVKAVANLLDVNKFVVDLGDNKYLIMLGGYLFEINKSLSGNVYVGINVTNGELQGQDSNSSYQGLTYSTSDLSSMTYSIQLLENGVVPESSKLKYDINNVFYGDSSLTNILGTSFLENVIDGGEITTT